MVYDPDTDYEGKESADSARNANGTANSSTTYVSTQAGAGQTEAGRIDVTNTTDSNGNNVTTVTTTTVNFSSAPGQEQKLLGATQTIQTSTTDKDTGQTTAAPSQKTTISLAKAVQVIGAGAVNKARNAADATRSGYTLRGMGQTVRDHPVKVAMGAAGAIAGAIAAGANPLSGARILAGSLGMLVGAANDYCVAGGPGC